MTPTLCRMVIYTDGDGKEWPAVVQRVHGDTCVDLTVFTNRGPIVRTSAVLGSAGELGRWRWPVVERPAPPQRPAPPPPPPPANETSTEGTKPEKS